MKLEKVLAVWVSVVPALAQYAGPAILSRGEAPAAMAIQEVDFRPFVEVAAVYDTGLAGVSVNAQGDLGNQASEGVSISGGVSGLHSWKHTKVGLNYSAQILHYAQQTYYDSINQHLMLSVSQQFTRHIVLSLALSGGEFSQDFSQPGLPQTVPFDPSTTAVPTTDFFDNRTYYVNASARLIWQKTARLSFSFTGLGFLVRRRSAALYGSNEESAGGDVQYRMSRTTTVGASYSYVHITFPGIFSSTDVHMGTLTYAWRASRWLEVSGYGGISRLEDKFAQEVPLDPVIQALLGIQYGTGVSYHVNYIPSFGLRISRTFPRGVLFGNGGRSVVPGNGLFLTSVMTTLGGGYAYTGLRRWSLGASVNYSKAQSQGNVIGRYDTLFGGITASRQILPSVHFVTSVNARSYKSPDFPKYNRPIYDVRVGLGFSPGNIPLRIW